MQKDTLLLVELTCTAKITNPIKSLTKVNVSYSQFRPKNKSSLFIKIFIAPTIAQHSPSYNRAFLTQP